MPAIMAFGLGFVIGALIVMLIFRTFVVGKLRIDRSEPEDGAYMFLELSKGVDQVENKSYVILKVKSDNFIPHK